MSLCGLQHNFHMSSAAPRQGFLTLFSLPCSAITLREHPGTVIVTDSVTSNGLADFIASLGGQHFRFKKGYRNIINKGIELNKAGTDCPLMMETSGHGAMKVRMVVAANLGACMTVLTADRVTCLPARYAFHNVTPCGLIHRRTSSWTTAATAR